MRYLFALLILYIEILANPGLLLAETPKYSGFFEAKKDAEEVLVKVATDYSTQKMTQEMIQNFVRETMNELSKIKKKDNIEYAVYLDMRTNRHEDLQKGLVTISTVIQYADKKGNISWDFETVFDQEVVSLYVNVFDKDNLKVEKSPEDYYMWKYIPRQKT